MTSLGGIRLFAFGTQGPVDPFHGYLGLRWSVQQPVEQTSHFKREMVRVYGFRQASDLSCKV